jgi:hypothetical protein
MAEPSASISLYAIVARRAPVAVVFRHGPTRQVELLRWDLLTDEVEAGQWLKGRIYERRSDLSPDGTLLAYFAGKYETPLRTWTAISRPPFLTALAMWPKGDAWGGGGLFEDQRTFLLNHKAHETTADPDHRPFGLHVRSTGEWSGHGEDDPIHHVRLLRDGWHMIDNCASPTEHGQRHPTWITFDPPIRYRRGQSKTSPIMLERSLEGIHERQGRWYVTSHVVRTERRIIRDVGRSDWADWGPNGDLLVATDGRLLHLDGSSEASLSDAPMAEVADLRSHTFVARAAPPAATRW